MKLCVATAEDHCHWHPTRHPNLVVHCNSATISYMSPFSMANSILLIELVTPSVLPLSRSSGNRDFPSLAVHSFQHADQYKSFLDFGSGNPPKRTSLADHLRGCPILRPQIKAISHRCWHHQNGLERTHESRADIWHPRCDSDLPSPP